MACRMSAGTVVWPLAVIVDSDIQFPYIGEIVMRLDSICKHLAQTAESMRSHPPITPICIIFMAFILKYADKNHILDTNERNTIYR